MCGIAGIITIDSGPPPDLSLLRRMVGRLGHRGPDSSGTFRDRNAALGHARLAIIDLEGGAQPLCNEDRSVWVTFNGEIFNYVELAEELSALGHRFQTKSDTEVIVHAYEEWGTKCFERFNGQWAIVLWDSRNGGQAVMSRDRLGIRPLYFTICAGRLLFASEIKALFADPLVPRAFDREGLAEVFTFWCPVAPRTVFQGIEQLEPGYFAIIKDGAIKKAPYWRLQFAEQGSVVSNEWHEWPSTSAPRCSFLPTPITRGDDPR